MRYALIIAVLAVVACGSDRETITEPARPLRLEQITLDMSPDANGRHPARIDLIRARDVTVIDRLLSFGTRSWFGETRDAFRKAHPAVQFDSWEIVPGTTIGPVDLAIEDWVGGVLFCGTLNLSTVSPPIRFERDGEVVVQIDDVGCTLRGGSASKEPAWWQEWLRDWW